MRKGDVIKVKTNAELLNKLFGTNYNGWQKSVYDCEGIRVWMIYLDHKERITLLLQDLQSILRGFKKSNMYILFFYVNKLFFE